MKNLKINTKSQIKNWNDFFWLSLIFLLVALYLYFRDGYSIGLIAFYVFLGIQFSFTLYIYLRYYFQNKGEEYILESKSITRTTNGKKEIILNSDIKKIEICKSANMDKWGVPYTTFEGFRCARVYLNNGDKFIMTNLLEYDLEKPLQILQGVKFVRRKGFSFFI